MEHKPGLTPASANELQKLLFDNRIPKYHPRYNNSPELVHFLYMLILAADIPLEEVNLSNLDLIIHHYFCTDTRDVVRYKATSNFMLGLGAVAKHIDLPRYFTPNRFRAVKEGDTVLVRHDSATDSTEVQILPKGLFGEDEFADYRIFTIDRNRLSMYSRFMVKEKFDTE